MEKLKRKSSLYGGNGKIQDIRHPRRQISVRVDEKNWEKLIDTEMYKCIIVVTLFYSKK